MQFWSESLGAPLECWSTERGLCSAKIYSDIYVRVQRIRDIFQTKWRLLCSRVLILDRNWPFWVWRERGRGRGGEGNLVSRALISKEKAISFPEPKCHTWAPETRLRKKPWGTRLGGNISRAHPELKGKLFLLILNTTNLGFKIFIPTLKLGMYNKV